LNNPEFVKVKNKKYKINTDFRVAIECNEISLSDNINSYEKSLAIIYLLFGEIGLNDTDNYEQLLKLAYKYLNCGIEQTDYEEEPDMDFVKDKKLIESSFKYDYGYNPYQMKYLHWWDFYNDVCNLSNSEFGSCCVLSRVRTLRTYDTSQIKDIATREKIERAKEQVALRKVIDNRTDEQRRLDELFEKQLRGE
jgi:hypothetical protein